MIDFRELLEKKIKEDGKIKYLIPKNAQTANEIIEIVECLRGCFKELKKNPSNFKISNRPENKKTVQHILELPEAKIQDPSIKSKIIRFISDLPLGSSFKKAESNDKGDDYVYIFVVKDCIKKLSVQGYNAKQNKKHSGTSLYLKFNFKVYEDLDQKIKVDPDTIFIETISIHPSNWHYI